MRIFNVTESKTKTVQMNDKWTLDPYREGIPYFFIFTKKHFFPQRELFFQQENGQTRWISRVTESFENENNVN